MPSASMMRWVPFFSKSRASSGAGFAFFSLRGLGLSRGGGGTSLGFGSLLPRAPVEESRRCDLHRLFIIDDVSS